MRKIFKNGFVMVLAFTLFITTFTGFAKAQEIEKSEEELIDEMAAYLEHITEDAIIFDKLGNPIGIDIDLIEGNYGINQELRDFKREILADGGLVAKRPGVGTGPVVTPMGDPKIDACINKKIKTAYKEYLSVAAISTVFTYIFQKNYKAAAKKIIKMGVRGNLVSIAAQLAYYSFYCTWKVKGW